jgi:alpha-tubulin suppressor-like RCC1 family protein
MNLSASRTNWGNIFMFATEDDELLVWGDNEVGALGLGDEVSRTEPCILNLPDEETTDTPTDPNNHNRAPPKKFQWASVSCGFAHALALTNNGKIYGWGRSDSGQIGTGETYDLILRPVHIPLPMKEKSTRVCCGFYHSAAITEEGELYLWGRNSCNQLGFKAVDIYSPKKVKNLPAPVVDVSCGYDYTMVMTKYGQVLFWGQSMHTGMGAGRAQATAQPYRTIEIQGVSRLISAPYLSVLTTDGRLLAWGEMPFSLWPDDNHKSIFPPKMVLDEIQEVAHGSFFCVAVKKDQSVWIFGGGGFDSLSLGGGKIPTVPEKVSVGFPGGGKKEIAMIGAGFSFIYFLTVEGELYVFGEEGKLGTGSLSSSATMELVTNFKFKLPPLTSSGIWTEIAQWLFLGRADTKSLLSLPVELIFHFVTTCMSQFS